MHACLNAIVGVSVCVPFYATKCLGLESCRPIRPGEEKGVLAARGRWPDPAAAALQQPAAACLHGGINRGKKAKMALKEG